MGMRDSVTVSMAEESSGVFSVISLVNWVCVLTCALAAMRLYDLRHTCATRAAKSGYRSGDAGGHAWAFENPDGTACSPTQAHQAKAMSCSKSPMWLNRLAAFEKQQTALMQ